MGGEQRCGRSVALGKRANAWKLWARRQSPNWIDLSRGASDVAPAADDLEVIVASDAGIGVIGTLDAGRESFRGSRAAKFALVAADLFTIALAMFAAAVRQHAVRGQQSRCGRDRSALAGLLAAPLWLLVFARYKLYNASAVSSRLAESNRILHAVAASVAGTALVAVLLNSGVSRAWLVLTAVFAFPALLLEREVARRVFARVRANGHLGRRVLIIGTNAEARQHVRDARVQSVVGIRRHRLRRERPPRRDPEPAVAGARRLLRCGRRARARAGDGRHHRDERDRRRHRECARTRPDGQGIPRRADGGPRRHRGRSTHRPAARPPARALRRAGAPRRLARRREAAVRPRDGGLDAAGAPAAARGVRRPRQGRLARAGVLPAGATRQGRQAVQAREAPDDGRRCRAHGRRVADAQRGRRSAVQAARKTRASRASVASCARPRSTRCPSSGTSSGAR